MAKRPSRGDVSVGVRGDLPEPSQKVPVKPKSREEKQAAYRRYGKVAPWRLPPDLIAAVAEAARGHDVSPRDFAEFLLRDGLSRDQEGEVRLAVREKDAPGHEIARYPTGE